MAKKRVKRLFEQLRPSSYALSLRLDKEKMTFTGSVDISAIKSGRPSKRITLHQNDLEIISASITHTDKKGNKKQLDVKRINKHAKFNEVRLHTDTTVFLGNYDLRLEFSGIISKQMQGMYPCYFKHKNKEEFLIATQFESHHAREVFPCIDEPEAKAEFSLYLDVPNDDVTISNTPIETEIKNGKRKLVKFQKTPIMSSYLLAFVSGKMSFASTKTKDGTEIRIYATPDNIKQTEFALETARRCLEFYNQYFEIPYPLEKCDFIALPDFSSGAMENWGCITFREQTLLVDETATSLANKQYVAMVIAHELAHQWFGNLVTMRWWTDLWLNEGFASWIEYMAVDKLFPDWEMWTQFLVDEQLPAFGLDALKNTHPIEVGVNDPEEIASIFDTISYAKGASVIHMLHGYLGADEFRKGLKSYLKQHAYGNTDTVDLWKALEKSSGKPVESFMSKWTTQPGFPLLDCKITKDKLELSQTRFTLKPRQEADLSTWPIVLNATEDFKNKLFTEKNDSFQLVEPANFLLNKGRNDFYRVNYSPDHTKNLAGLISAGKIDPLDRLGLLSDTFESCKSGDSTAMEFFDLLKSYPEEDSYPVWGIISSAISTTKRVMDDEKIRTKMNTLVQQLIEPQLKLLGWDLDKNDSHFQKLLRPLILGLSSSANDEKTNKKCRQIYNEMFSTSTSKARLIDPDIQSLVLVNVARHGGVPEYKQLEQAHDTSTHAEEKLRLCSALTNFKSPELIKKSLEKIKTDSVRSQDATYWVVYSFMNRYAKDLSWDWLTTNWDWLKNTLGRDLSFYRMPVYAARVFSDPKFIPKYTAFFEPKLTPAIERSYRQGLEMLEWQSAWKSRDQIPLRSYLN